ncbi:MAG: radical SAM protein, partial [Synechococcaceae cyanobacterium]
RPAVPGLRLTRGVSTFVPQAHPPFQGQPVRTEAEKRLQRLAKLLTPKGIELRPESYGWIVIQALLSRGDRRLAPVIAAVRSAPSSLGSWKRAYREAQASHGLPAPPAWSDLVHGVWSAETVLPWQHLRGPLPPATLRQHHDDALATYGSCASPSAVA